MRLTSPILATLAILFYSVTAMAQDDERSQARESLKGLRTVVVRVELSSMDAFPDDPSEDELKGVVEQRLRIAGLKVHQRAWDAKDEYPTLVVNFSFSNENIFYFQYLVRTSLRQTVRLARSPEVSLTSSTYEWYSSGLVGGSTKRDAFNENIDMFICDFRRVNPEIKGPLPDCYSPARYMKDPEIPKGKQPTVITKLNEKLIRAAGLNELAEVRALVAKGAEVNARDQVDTTALTYAVRTGNRKTGDAAVLRFLLTKGADPNANSSCRLTSLMYAIERGDLEAVKLLLDHGADPNAATPEGYTALMAAASLGNPDAVALLLKHNADAQAQTRQGETALTLARLYRNRIAGYDRTPTEYSNIPEDTLLKQAQAKHDRIIELLQSGRP